MMSLIGQTILFLLGMSLCVQWVAALYGIVDLRHAVGSAYRRQVIRRMLVCGALTVAIAWLLGSHLRDAFLWGMAAYLFFFFFAFYALKLFLMRNRRLLSGE